jgi:hypothetical protein
MLKEHWAVLGRLRGAGVTMATVIGQYHARGVKPLWRRPLRLCEMMTDRAPWTGTLTALAFPSPNKIERCMAQAIRKSTYTWTPTQLLLMLPTRRPRSWYVVASSHKFFVSLASLIWCWSSRGPFMMADSSAPCFRS